MDSGLISRRTSIRAMSGSVSFEHNNVTGVCLLGLVYRYVVNNNSTRAVSMNCCMQIRRNLRVNTKAKVRMNGECLEEGWAYFEIKNEIKIYDLVEKNSLILKYRDIIYKLLF